MATVEAPLKTVAKFHLFLAPEMVPTFYLICRRARQVIAVANLGDNVKTSRNGPYKDIRFGATLRNDHDNFSPAFAGLRFGKSFKQTCTQGKLQKPWKTFRKLKTARNLRNSAETMQKPMRKPSKPAQNGGNPAETLRKPCGNPKKLAENLRKPFGNSAETLQKPKETPTFSLWKLKCLNEGWRPITSKEELQDPCYSIIRPLRLKGVQLFDHNGPWSRCCRWLKTTFLRNLYTCDLPALVLVRLHLESSFLKISTCELFSPKRSTCKHFF